MSRARDPIRQLTCVRESPMRFFRREVEVALKTLGIVALVGLIVLPMAWGFQQRRLAQTWQSVACAYRMKEVARQGPLLEGIDPDADACVTLERLGLQLELARYVEPPRSVRPSRPEGSSTLRGGQPGKGASAVGSFEPTEDVSGRGERLRLARWPLQHENATPVGQTR